MITQNLSRGLHVKNNVVRWGTIGCGQVVEQKSGPSFREVAHSQWAGVMCRSSALVKDFAERHKIPLWSTDADEIINNPAIDAIYIATPPQHHLEYGLKVCKAGKPCLIEKPGGRSSQEWGQLAEAFREAGVPLFISFYRRFLPKFIKVKEILDSGELGTITSIQYRHACPGVANSWRVDPERSGGGLFWDIGGHFLDLLEFWFEPVEFTGGTAANLKDSYPVEDIVSLCFRTKTGALGVALWDFTVKTESEQLVIQGSLGKLSFSCVNPWTPCTLEIYSPVIARKAVRLDLTTRVLNKLKKELNIDGSGEKSRRIAYSFSRLPYAHAPMIGAIVDSLLGRSSGAHTSSLTSPVCALRTLRLMDRSLSDYYGGRQDSYWKRPVTWKNKQNMILSEYEKINSSTQDSRYKLSRNEVISFLENGYLGPFVCESPEIKSLIALPANEHDYHTTSSQVKNVCSHPSIVLRVSQLLNSSEVKLFKTRFRNKLPKAVNCEDRIVPWHQDVGERNGGYRRDGSPVPTVTVWLSVNGATEANGPVLVVPGSHRRFYGNWKQYIHAKLESEASVMAEINRARIRSFIAKPGEFYIFHSWLLHSSGTNTSNSPRTGLNMRFMSARDSVEPLYDYITLSAK